MPSVPNWSEPAPVATGPFHLYPDKPAKLGENPEKILAMDWLLPGWLEHRDAVVWAGDPGIGKSVLVTAICVALAAGKKPLDFWPAAAPLRIAIIDLENKPEVLQRRVIRICNGLGLDYNSLLGADGPLFLYGLRDIGLMGPHFQALRDELRSNCLDLYVLDTIMSATTQDDLGPLQGTQFVRRVMFALSRDLGPRVSPWAIHHTKKPEAMQQQGDRIGDLHQVSGGGFVGTTDATILVQDDGASNIVLTNPKQRHRRDVNRYYLTLSEPDPTILRLTLAEKVAALPNPDLAFIYQAIQAQEGVQGFPGVSRPELCRMLADRLGVGIRAAKHKITQWVDLQQLRPTGHKRQGARGGPAADMLTVP